MKSAIKMEFLQWIKNLDTQSLTEIDVKLLNLLVSNFDELLPLTTSSGKSNRATRISSLIESNHKNLPTTFPEIKVEKLENADLIKRITSLEIGPFRGFASNESFVFDKKFTFLYGPNGSGKTSFCEGLEYALIGEIEEAYAKRIGIQEYILNIEKNLVESPKVYGINCEDRRIEISPNQSLYRFAFIEKNKIDGFARISAATAGIQKNRIATLFGLDAFSTFVDGFTDNFERYITIKNEKEEAFKLENQHIKIKVDRKNTISEELLRNKKESESLIKEVNRKEIKTTDELKIFLSGEDGISGYIGSIQEMKSEVIPIDLGVDALDKPLTILEDIRATLASLDTDLDKFVSLSADINYKDLYSSIDSIANTPEADLTVCPACKTPIEEVTTNPFDNARKELSNLQTLSELQEKIPVTSNSLSQYIRTMNSALRIVNELCAKAEYKEEVIPEFTEFTYSDIGHIKDWKKVLETELLYFDDIDVKIVAMRTAISLHNENLAVKRKKQLEIDVELKKYTDFKTKAIELSANKQKLKAELNDLIKEIDDFTKSNTEKNKEIEEENRKIAINLRYVESYKKLIENLKARRDRLPSLLSKGLSEKVKEYYNIVNSHDPEFERIESLSLPSEAGGIVEIKFMGDNRPNNALNILSEGHIKVLGLSILLAKAVNEELGFLIFDDIVNAIDDDHRKGIADLLMCHKDFEHHQIVLTCHGEDFINKLEHKLGSSYVGKNVRHYNFFPGDKLTSRGIKISIGNSKHYILKAEESFEKNELKDAAFYCRKSVENIANQLWKKLVKRLQMNLSVSMRSPHASPDLSSVVDSLINKIRGIVGIEGLYGNLSQLKSKYSWSLLNRGAHENDNQPEFDRGDIKELILLLKEIESMISELKLEVSAV